MMGDTYKMPKTKDERIGQIADSIKQNGNGSKRT